jgi:phosphate transport system permease protein
MHEQVLVARTRPRETTRDDVIAAAAAGASALALSWVVFARLTDGVGWFGFGVFAYLTFLLLHWLVTRDRLGPLVAKDRLATTVVFTGSLGLLAPLALLVGYVFVRGFPALRLSFFVNDMGGVTATDPATEGGAAHAIVGTLEQVLLALIISVPLALACAVFLNETRSRFRRPVRVLVDAMSGLPSVLCGLFIFAVLIIPFAETTPVFGYNGFMASLALSMVMIPTITRTVEVVLRLVPDGLREASLAMGATRARTVWSVVLPTARSGLTTAVVLGIARAVGETAPLLFTSFGYDLMNANPFSGPQESLPLFVLKNVRKPAEESIDRGFTGALVLMLLVLSLFVLARFLGRDRSAAAGVGRRRRGRRGRRRTVLVDPNPAPIDDGDVIDLTTTDGAPALTSRKGFVTP